MSRFEMTRLVLKWVVSKPVTTHYPIAPRVLIPGSRGVIEFTKTTCVYCNVCAKRCPTGAIVVQRAQKRWTIDPLLCISCGCCVEVCPKKSLHLSPAHGAPSVIKDRARYGA